MEISIEKVMNDKIATIFEKMGIDKKFAIIKNSDRPDLGDFQCNSALALTRELKRPPRDIAADIVEELKKDNDIEALSIDGPGFINIKLKNEFLAKTIDEISKSNRFGVYEIEKPKKVVLDFGGPNVAKAMHVGHLRSGVIGEAVQRIERFIGNDVVSDVHLGDWGTPMGMIIAEILADNLDPYSLSVEEITALYKRANIKCKEDEKAKENARIITAKLQDGDKEYRKIWQYIRDASVEDVKQNYLALDINFDLWLGESDAHDTSADIVKIAKEKNIAELDAGALIIRLEEDKKPMPPVILEKSDGGYTYHTTDIATIKMRVDDLKADEIIYFTDKRQSLHFEQVFEATKKLEIAPNVELKHIGFGTVNGADGKPFKTRDGGVMNLEDLIILSKEKVAESMPKAGEVEEYSQDYIDNLTNEIAIGAIKFQDLKNNIASGYVFEVDDFAKFEGKTGPYIQYAIARINSIMRKAKENGLSSENIIISNKEERELALKIMQLNSVVVRAYNDKEPSIISDYTYNIAQTFSSFYNVSSIMNEEDKDLASSRLKLAQLTRDIMELMLYLLGIKSPEVMLKASTN